MNPLLKFKAWDESTKMWYNSSASSSENKGFYFPWGFQTGLDHVIIVQFSGVSDKNLMEVYADDILTDGKKKFRVYQVEGGFVIKAYAWADNRKDLIPSDELIFMPLADAQTKSYIMQSCEVIGNLNSNPELI